jgi:transcriptional regulator with XRE-family HTH domain
MAKKESNDYDVTVMETIQAIRGISNLKQKDIAKKMGVHYTTYWKLEKGLSKMNLKLFKEFCQAVGYPPLQVFELINKIWESKLAGNQVNYKIQVFKYLVLNDSEIK